MRDGPLPRTWRGIAVLLLVVVALSAPMGNVWAAGPPVGPMVAPQITATDPTADATGVPTSSAIQVRFSETMNAPTVAYSIAPTVPFTATWPTTDILLLSPNPPGFANCTIYTVQVSGTDVDVGLSLVPGSAANPWSFATVCDQTTVTQTG